MTEIQFLISIMLEHKLPGPVKDLFIKRIGEVEALLSRPGYAPSIPPRLIAPNAQVPSTQKILDDMASNPTIPLTPSVMTKRIVGGEVSTGNGTKGPRKF